MQFYRFIFLFFLTILYVSIESISAQESPYASRIIEYNPAPGQFINTAIGNPFAAESLLDGFSGMLSLGGFGGYVVLGFDHAVENNVDNPYGVDFTVFGNANEFSSEPAAVYVMQDENQNGQADDTWFLLAGSDYYFSQSHVAYQITYQNPGTDSTANIPWNDNYGNTGFIVHNSFHTQAYYPASDSFPNISSQDYTLNGLLIQPRINTQNETFVTTQRYPFGFADNTPRNLSNSSLNPNNPYTPELEGLGGDSFDISWAVDTDGNFVDLQAVDFIKIQTAVNTSAGWLGELSAEVSGVLDIAPDTDLTGEMRKLVLEPTFNALEIEGSYRFNAWYFYQGIPQTTPLLEFWISDTAIATVDNLGYLKAKKAGEFWLYASLETDSQIKDSLLLTVENATGLMAVEAMDLIVFPNPVFDGFELSCSQPIHNITLYNALGERMPLNQLASHKFDASHLPSGVYLVWVKVGNEHLVKKLIKR
jgi:hypothetical protein